MWKKQVRRFRQFNLKYVYQVPQCEFVYNTIILLKCHSNLGFQIEVWVCGGELKLYPISPHNLVMNLKDLTHFKEDSNAVVHFEPNPAEHRFFYLPK